MRPIVVAGGETPEAWVLRLPEDGGEPVGRRGLWPSPLKNFVPGTGPGEAMRPTSGDGARGPA